MTMLSTNPGHSPITKGKKTMAKKKNAVADSAIDDELVLDLCEEIKLARGPGNRVLKHAHVPNLLDAIGDQACRDYFGIRGNTTVPPKKKAAKKKTTGEGSVQAPAAKTEGGASDEPPKE